jgi:hypothetical protein
MIGIIGSSISSGADLASHALSGSETLPKGVAVIILFSMLRCEGLKFYFHMEMQFCC